jgi:hypothetical protein
VLVDLGEPNYWWGTAHISDDGCVVMADSPDFGPEGMPRGSRVYRYLGEELGWRLVGPGNLYARLVAMSRNGETAVVKLLDSKVTRVWSVVDGAWTTQPPGVPQDLSGNGHVVVSIDDTHVYLSTLEGVATLDGPGGDVPLRAAAMSADGEVVYVATDKVFRYTSSSGFVEVLGAQVTVPATPSVFATSADGATVVWLDRLWHFDGSQLAADELQLPAGSHIADLSSDGTTVVGQAADDREILVRRAAPSSVVYLEESLLGALGKERFKSVQTVSGDGTRVAGFFAKMDVNARAYVAAPP